MSDLVERLRHAHEHSQQRIVGSNIFDEAAAELTRIRERCDAEERWRKDKERLLRNTEIALKAAEARADAMQERAALVADKAMAEFSDLFDDARLRDSPNARETATICAKSAREIADAIRALTPEAK